MTKFALSHLCLLPLAFFSIELYAVNPPCATAPPGLVAWWPAQGDGRDLIGDHSGQSPNGVGFEPGEVGLAFSFDGTNNYVEVADSPDLRLTNVLTIEFWVKRLRFDSPTLPFAEYIVEKGGDWTAGVQNYAVALHNAQYNYALHFLFAGGWRGGGSIADTNWHHCAVVARQGDVDPLLYIDGLQQPITYREGVATINLYPSTLPLHIGAQLDTNWNYFSKTVIDELSLYRRALSNSEIQAIFNAGSAGKCVPIPPSPCVAPPPGLVSWWAGQGNALDSADSNNGSLSGNAAFGEGRVGQAFTLDGNADAIVVGNPTNLQLQNFTIETWMRRANASISSFGSHGNALLFGYGSGGYGLGFRDDGSLFLTRVDIDNVTITNGITDTLWHHVAVTKIDTNVVFYIDGTAYTAPPYNTTFTFATVAAIGARADTMDDSLLGAVDEVSVYNRVLSAAEIQAIYNAGASGKCRTPTKPFILTQPAGIAAYVGDSVTLSVVAGGDVPLSYQWLLNGSSLPGRTGAALTLANIQTTNAGLYSVSISNAADSVLSSNALVTVGPRPPCVPAAPGIVSWWPAQSNALDAIDNNNGTLLGNVTLVPGRVGQAFRFDGSADAVRVGNPTNLQLQDFTIETWIKRSSPTIATFGTHTTALFFGYGSGGYGFGMFDDGRLFLTKIDIDNVALATSLTDTNNFHHIAVTKSNTTVVFYIDGVAFPELAYSSAFSFSTQAAIGARGDTLDDSFFGSIDELAVYSRALGADEILAIYNADGSGKCRVPRPPAIVTQPRSQTNYIGDTVTFTVGATGDTPLSYQWRFEGNNLAGRTASSLVLGNVQTNSAGNYSVIVTNAVGSVTSSNALLAVVPRPPCTPIPNGLVSWWRGENNLVDGAGLNDGVATTASPLFLPGKVGNAFNFVNSRFLQVPDAPSLRLTNSLSLEAWVFPTLTGSALRTIISKPPAVVPIFPPAPPAPPQGGYLFALTNNGAVVFSLITRTGVQATNRTLVTSQLLPPNQWSFLVATYDGSVMSVYINGSLAAQIDNPLPPPAGTDDLFIGAAGTGPIRFPDPGLPSGVSPFTGLIDELSVYNRALGPDEIQAIYAADVSGKCPVPLAITVQPKSQQIPLGEDVLFSVGATGTRPYLYQWRFNGSPIFGATASTLVLERLETNRAGNYSVSVSNSLNGALSSNALLTLLPAPSCVPSPPGAVSWWPADNNGVDAAGSNNASVVPPATFSIGKVGSGFRILSSGVLTTVPIQVPNSPSLNFGSNADFSIEGWVKLPSTNTSSTNTILEKRDTLNGYSLFLAGGRLAYWLGASSSSSTLVSSGPDLRDGMFHHVAASFNRSTTNGARLYVDGLPVLSFDLSARRGSVSNGIALGIGSPLKSATFYDGTNAFNGFIDELAIYNRALTSDEVLSIRQAGAAGKCKVKPFIITQPLSQRVNVGSNVTFSVTAGGGTPLRYQWLHNGLAVAGASSTSLSFPAQVGSSGTYSVRVTNAFGLAVSSNAVLLVNTAPVAQSQQLTLNEDTPTSVTLLAADTQLDPLTYSVLSQPAHGVLTGTPPNLTYSPALDYNGPDSFQFKANDGLLDSGPATVSITVLPVNDPPVASIQVGPLFSLTPGDTNLLVLSLNNSNAQVILDGSGSTDVENDPLTFAWWEGTNFLGSGVLYSNAFTINPHTVTLQVNDGQDTGSAVVTFNVISPADSARMMFGMVQLSDLPLQTARPLGASLKAAASAFDSGNSAAAINVLQAFQNKVRAQVQPSDPVLAAELIDAAQKMIDAWTNSP